MQTAAEKKAIVWFWKWNFVKEEECRERVRSKKSINIMNSISMNVFDLGFLSWYWKKTISKKKIRCGRRYQIKCNYISQYYYLFSFFFFYILCSCLIDHLENVREISYVLHITVWLQLLLFISQRLNTISIHQPKW